MAGVCPWWIALAPAKRLSSRGGRSCSAGDWRTATLFGALALLAIGISAANAQPYPSKPIASSCRSRPGRRRCAGAHHQRSAQESLGRGDRGEPCRAGRHDRRRTSSPRAPLTVHHPGSTPTAKRSARRSIATLPVDTLKDSIPVTQLVATSTVLGCQSKLRQRAYRS